MRRRVPVGVVGVRPDELAEGSLVRQAADRYRGLGGAIVPAATDLGLDDVRGSLIVDALLGTGLTRPVSGVYAHLIGLINAAGLPVVACDIPSGVDADTGAIMGGAVRAHRTVVMGLPKPACVLTPGCTYFGDITILDIGLPDAVMPRG